MLKWIGVVCLLVGSAGLGLAAVRKMDMRVQTLGALIEVLERMERELDFRCSPMKELIAQAARNARAPVDGFLRVCAQNMDALQRGCSFAEVWESAARAELTALQPCDFVLLSSLATALGRFDVQSQRRAITSVCAQLAEHRADALAKRQGQGKMYGTLAVAGGMFLAIILA